MIAITPTIAVTTPKTIAAWTDVVWSRAIFPKNDQPVHRATVISVYASQATREQYEWPVAGHPPQACAVGAEDVGVRLPLLIALAALALPATAQADDAIIVKRVPGLD